MIHISQKDSISLLLILNGIGIFGRLIPNYLADRLTGPLNLLIPFAFLSGLCMFGWIGVRDRAGLITFAAFYGIGGAGIQGLFPATLSSLTKDLRKAGVRMGMVFSICSFACLTGAPIAGALVQRGHGDYMYGQVFAGSVLLAGCLTMTAARIAQTGLVLRTRM